MLKPTISEDGDLPLLIRHQTLYTYDGGASHAAMLLKLGDKISFNAFFKTTYR